MSLVCDNARQESTSQETRGGLSPSKARRAVGGEEKGSVVMRHKKLAKKRRVRTHRAASGVNVTSRFGATSRDQADYGGGLRSYGHGKFNTFLDSHVYDLTMDGTTEQTGDVEGSGHYALVHLGPGAIRYIKSEAKGEGDKLNAAELHKIRTSVGAICRTDERGFVDCTYYRTKKALSDAWERAEAHAAEYSSGEDY